MEFLTRARFTRGLAGAMSLAVLITCASPTSPTSRESRTTSFEPHIAAATSAVAYVEVRLEPSPTTQPQTSVRARALARTATGQPLWNAPAPKWTSSNPAVAGVDSMTGRVLAYTAGTALIIATIDGVKGQAPLTVTGSAPPPVPAVAAVSVSLAASTLQVGQTTTASAEARDASGNPLTGRAVSWSSTTNAIATVNGSTGLVTAVSAGTAEIVATVEGVSGRAAIRVTAVPPPPAPVASVNVTLDDAALQVGQTTTAAVALRDALGNVLTGRTVSWTSSATAVATINGTGLVTAVGPGTASIIASSEGISGSASITVSAPPPPTPPPGELVFASDWHTARGNTTFAVTDGSKWDEAFNISFTPDRVSVVAAAGFGFPAGMENVLALRYPNTLNGQLDQMYSGINKQNGWELPPVGGSLYFRMYFRFDIGGTGGGTHHPVQSCVAAGSGCGQSWMKFQKPSSGETIPFIIETNGTGSQSGSANHHIWVVSGLQRGVTYRVEEQYERVGTNTWIVRARIYDSANSLIRSPSDFVCGFYHGGHTMGDDIRFPFGDASFLRHRTIRNQGVGGGRGSDDPNHQRIYYGGFAVSLSDWIGPYRAGESP